MSLPTPWEDFVAMHSNAAQLAGFDPHNPTADTLSAFWERVGKDIEALHRLGPDVMYLDRPVEGHQYKWKLMCEHCQSGHAWVSIPDVLGIRYGVQVRIITNGRHSPLYEWEEGNQIACEEDIRDGMTVYRLQKVYDLPRFQTVRLTTMIRGRELG